VTAAERLLQGKVCVITGSSRQRAEHQGKYKQKTLRTVADRTLREGNWKLNKLKRSTKKIPRAVGRRDKESKREGGTFSTKRGDFAAHAGCKRFRYWKTKGGKINKRAQSRLNLCSVIKNRRGLKGPKKESTTLPDSPEEKTWNCTGCIFMQRMGASCRTVTGPAAVKRGTDKGSHICVRTKEQNSVERGEGGPRKTNSKKE